MISSIIIRRQTTGCSRQVSSLRTRRLLSTMAPPPKPVLPPSAPHSLVSRRAWKKLYEPPPRKPRGKDPLDDKPWPRSVKILGAVVGVTAVPYSIAWFVAENTTIREAIDPMAPQVAPFLRQWFGDEEEDAVSYVDRREEGDQLEVPRSLDQEITAKERKEQASLRTLIEDHLVPTRIRVFTEGGFNLGEIVDLPGTTLANTKTLLEVLMKDRDRTIDEESVSHVTVEFTDVREAAQEMTDDVILQVHLPEDNTSLKAQIDRMLKATSIFSAWHLFPEIVIQQQQQKQKQQPQAPAKGQDDMRMAQLEYEIEQLEAQLNDRNTTRSFADIEDDLSAHKSELRRLKWRRRLRFFG